MPFSTNLSGGVWDSQSDIYNFNMPGLSGKMVYDINGNLHHTPLDKNLKIVRGTSDWVIKDDKGNSYYFSEKETTFNQQAQRAADVTAWHLVGIISADLTDTISLNYIPAQTISEEMESYSFSVNMTPLPDVGECNPLGPLEQSFSKTSNTYGYNRVLLKSINFNQGRIEFEYLTDRQDPGKERPPLAQVFRLSGSLVTFKIRPIVSGIRITNAQSQSAPVHLCSNLWRYRIYNATAPKLNHSLQDFHEDNLNVVSSFLRCLIEWDDNPVSKTGTLYYCCYFFRYKQIYLTSTLFCFHCYFLVLI